MTKGVSMKNLRYFRKFLQSNGKSVLSALIFSLISSILVIGFSFVLRFAIEGINSTESIINISLLLGFVVVIFIFQLLKSKLIVSASLKIQSDIMSSYFKTVYKLPLQRLQTTDPGNYLQRIIDIIYVEASIFNKGLPFIIDCMFLITCILILAWLNSLNLIFLIVFPFYFVLQKLLNKNQEKNVTQWRMSEEQLCNGILEDLKNIVVLKSFDCTNLALENITQKQTTLLSALGKMDISSAKRTSFTSLFNYLLVVLILCAQLFFSHTNFGDFTQSLSLILFMFGPISSVAFYFDDLQKGKVSAKRLLEIMNTETELTAKQKSSLTDINSIKLENLSFAYTNENTVLENINLSFKKGEYIAIVGENGAGKSTLLNCILGFLTPTSGNISFDNNSLGEIDSQNYISYVPQQVYILDDTLKENIVLHSDYLQDQFDTVCKKLAIDEIAKKLPNGWDTNIGGNNAKLSHGQCQLISIARALLKSDFKILILDEITSALDISTERKVLDTIAEFATDRIVLVVSHRLTSITNVTKIVLLENQKVSAVDTHKNLLGNSNYYKDLWDKQFS